MIHYLVIGIDGQRYGPADVDSLVQWAREGRLDADTILVEPGTEREVRADALPAIAAILHPARRGLSEPRGMAVDRETESPTLTSPGAPPIPPPPPLPVIEQVRVRRVGSKSRVVAGLLGIFLGVFGAHRFYLGYVGTGLLMLLLSTVGGVASIFCLPGASCGIVHLWGVIEGVICLMGGMRDANGRELN